MVSVLISVVSNTDSVHGQSADESRKAAFALFKKLKVCLFLAAIIIRSNEEWSSQLWTQFMPDKKNQDFNGIWTRDLAIAVRCSNELSYEATDVGSPLKSWFLFQTSYSIA